MSPRVAADSLGWTWTATSCTDNCGLEACGPAQNRLPETLDLERCPVCTPIPLRVGKENCGCTSSLTTSSGRPSPLATLGSEVAKTQQCSIRGGSILNRISKR